jgi:hypothetical protein
MAQEVEELNGRISALSAKVTKRKAAIITEMERRGTRAIEHDGRRLTYVQSETVVYDEDRILAGLSPAKREKVVRKVLDKGLLLAAVQAGTIKATFVTAHTSVRSNNPYYRFTKL